MLRAFRSLLQSKKERARRRLQRPDRGRTLRLESLERRDLMAGDMVGVVRGVDQYLLDTDRDPLAEIDLRYGLKKDQHVVGDWQQTGHHPGVVRSGNADGLLHWYLDTDGDPGYEIEHAYGLPGDIPVVGDWDGDGRDNIGVVRRGGDGLLHWYLDTDGDPGHEIEFAYGLPGDIPVVGNWDGRGSDNIGVVRPGGDGLLHWYLDTDGDPTHETEYAFGLPGDTPVVGNWDGRGGDNIGVVRPGGDGLLHWYLDTDGDSQHEIEVAYGVPGDKPITGTWKLPEVTLAGGDVNSSGTINFGTIIEGNPAPTRKFVFRNDGTTPLALSVTSVPQGFAVTQRLPASLQPGATATLTVRMESTTVGTFNSPIRIATNDGNETSLAFSLRGEVKSRPAPEVTVDWRAVNGTRRDVSDGGSIRLPDAVQGYTNGEIRIRVKNTGTAPLELSGLHMPPGFVLINGTLRDALPGQSQEIAVGLDTSEAGFRRGVLSFITNDADEGQFDIKLNGTVEAAAPRAAVSGVWDGGAIWPWAIGEIATFTITNTGNAPMTVGHVRTIGAYTVVLQPVKSQLAPGEAVQFKLLRQPGDYRGEVMFETNGVSDGLYNFAIDKPIWVIEVGHASVG